MEMRYEMPEISFKDMLMVPDGPPESVWERALDAAYATTEQDAVPDEASPDVAVSATEEAHLLTPDGDDSDVDPTAHDDGSVASAWDPGQEPDGGEGADGSNDAGDGLLGGSDDLGY
jgi:hypothetical protein